MKSYKKKFTNIILNFSASCNMMCKYCDFNDQIYNYKAINDKIRQSIIDGTYAKNIKEKTEEFKDQIEGINLWGLEPSINFDICENFFKEILDFYPNIKWFFYSTNCNLNLDMHKKVFDFFNNYNRKVIIKLQLSLDGPAWVTDENRQAGAMSRVLPTIDGMLDYAKTLNKNLCIEANLKPTLDSYHMQMLVDDDEKFHEYYKFFDELYYHFKEKESFYISVGIPTLVVPHYHTTEDGILLKEFIQKVIKYTKEYNFPLFQQASRESNMILTDTFLFASCSAGVDSLPIDYTGDLYGCHALFKMDYDGNEETARLAQTSRLNNDDEDFCWRTSLIPKNRDFFFNMWDGQIIALAAAGQIDPIYGKDKNARNLLKMIASNLVCPYGQMATTKSPWIPTMSFIRLLGNGAVPELLKLQILQNEMEREYEGY